VVAIPGCREEDRVGRRRRTWRRWLWSCVDEESRTGPSATWELPPDRRTTVDIHARTAVILRPHTAESTSCNPFFVAANGLNIVPPISHHITSHWDDIRTGLNGLCIREISVYHTKGICGYVISGDMPTVTEQMNDGDDKYCSAVYFEIITTCCNTFTWQPWPCL